MALTQSAQAQLRLTWASGYLPTHIEGPVRLGPCVNMAVPDFLPVTTEPLPGGSEIAVVYGTRPEIIKLAPVVKAFERLPLLIDTGQHYDANMSRDIASAAGLAPPAIVCRKIGGEPRHRQIGLMIEFLGESFTRTRPRVVLVQGDTNTVSAAAQAANYCGIPVVHVEAGLRSHDRGMPEEINRIVAGTLADVHCAATPENMANLRAEGVPLKRIVITGNTIVEATRSTLERTPADDLRYKHLPREFVLATIHRPENTDSPERLAEILTALGELEIPTLFVAHPRTRAAVEIAGLTDLLESLVVLDPMVHADFLRLAQRATLLVSDSGGIQEECTVLGKRLLVLRRSTERPESVRAGFATLVRPGEDIRRATGEAICDRQLRADLADRPSPYGDGRSGRRIAQIAQRIRDGLDPRFAAAN